MTIFDFIVRNLFRWDALREYIFEEVELYNSLSLTIEDMENAPELNTVMWDEGDGWRSRSYDEDRGIFVFNDVPEKTLLDAMERAVRE